MNGEQINGGWMVHNGGIEASKWMVAGLMDSGSCTVEA